MKNRIIIAIGIVILLGVAWYLVSPLFRVVEVDDEFPEIDKLDSMDAATRADFDAQMEVMRDVVMDGEDAMPTGLQVLSQADFKPRAHEVEGRALLVSSGGKTTLRFEDFNTVNGPQLHIYLSTGLGTDDFVDLGKIKATRGNVNYDIDPSIDTEKYNTVLVWCKPFGVLFSFAELF